MFHSDDCWMQMFERLIGQPIHSRYRDTYGDTYGRYNALRCSAHLDAYPTLFMSDAVCDAC